MTAVKKRVPILLGVLAILSGSCEFFQDDTPLIITLPVLPREYGSVISIWDITVLHGDLSTEFLSLDGSGSSFIISRSREEILCVLGKATLVSGFTLKPAGLLIIGQGEKNLKFEDGPALTVLVELSLRGFDLDRFNCMRFTEELINRQEVSPWFWDLDPLADLILLGEFSLLKLRSQPLYPVLLSENEEDWVSEDTTLGYIGSTLLNLPPGGHRFFSPSLGIMRDIMVNEDGNYLIFDLLLENDE
jgi:hypothetical protein